MSNRSEAKTPEDNSVQGDLFNASAYGVPPETIISHAPAIPSLYIEKEGPSIGVQDRVQLLLKALDYFSADNSGEGLERAFENDAPNTGLDQRYGPNLSEVVRGVAFKRDRLQRDGQTAFTGALAISHFTESEFQEGLKGLKEEDRAYFDPRFILHSFFRKYYDGELKDFQTPQGARESAKKERSRLRYRLNKVDAVYSKLSGGHETIAEQKKRAKKAKSY
ncbi:MAG: hypothetical protein ACREF5_02135 [Candidatus Saccharimonadales bacterium]